MSFNRPGLDAPEDPCCRYGNSRLSFRGPARSLEAPFLAFIGGTETFGRFIDRPYPDLLEKRLCRTCVNLGSINSGIEAVVGDAEALRIAQRAERVVIQLTGAQNLSNRLYRVHPRRNDRFLQPTVALTALFPEVDFTEFHFVRHLLGHLESFADARFEVVKEELRQAWIGQMRRLLGALGTRSLVLWLRYEGPLAEEQGGALGAEPFLIDDPMVNALADQVATIVEMPVTASGDSEDLGDMLFGTLQQPAAEHMIGPATHQAIADRLFGALQGLE